MMCVVISRSDGGSLAVPMKDDVDGAVHAALLCLKRDYSRTKPLRLTLELRDFSAAELKGFGEFEGW